MHILIDGYNLIRQSETLRRYDRQRLEAGRNALIQMLSLYKKQSGHRITVVFDAWDGGFALEERDRRGGVDILYSRKGETADTLIKRIAENRREELLVVTSDRDISDFVSRRGAAVIPSPAFESRLLESEARADREDEFKLPPEEDADDRKGTLSTKKKGASRRLSKKQKTLQTIYKKL